jgi:hypothetical protein
VSKVAEDVVEEIENALNLVVTTTHQSSNMRKTLKEKIYQTVSTLRRLLTKLTNSCEQKSSDIHNLTKKIGTLESELQSYKEQQQKRQQAPSIENNDEQGEKLNERQVVPSMDNMQQPSNSRVRQLPPPDGRNRKLFAEVLKGAEDKRFKMTLKAKDNETSPEQVKNRLKREINPTDIKVGIKTFKNLRDGRIIIETGSEEETNSLSSEIIIKCGEHLEIIKYQLRKPRIIIYSTPKEITTDNVIEIIKAQNSDITQNGEDMVAKLKYKTKKGNYNIVIEVGPQTRKQILQNKLKLGWEICSAKDYLAPTRCYRCSRFKPQTQRMQRRGHLPPLYRKACNERMHSPKE